jgi:hypothetical protein
VGELVAGARRAEGPPGGGPFRVIEMTAVRFDEEVPAEMFLIDIAPRVVCDDCEPRVGRME